ncbi:MAG: hypothetical protein P8Q97_00295 [Myxococcota bacterium]|nr:hypothetical protein [Myxococcota bacterium]
MAELHDSALINWVDVENLFGYVTAHEHGGNLRMLNARIEYLRWKKRISGGNEVILDADINFDLRLLIIGANISLSARIG